VRSGEDVELGARSRPVAGNRRRDRHLGPLPGSAFSGIAERGKKRYAKPLGRGSGGEMELGKPGGHRDAVRAVAGTRVGRTGGRAGRFSIVSIPPTPHWGLLFILQEPFHSIHGEPVRGVWDGGSAIELGIRGYQGGNAAGPGWDGRGTAGGNVGDQRGRGGYGSGKGGEPGRRVSR